MPGEPTLLIVNTKYNLRFGDCKKRGNQQQKLYVTPPALRMVLQSFQFAMSFSVDVRSRSTFPSRIWRLKGPTPHIHLSLWDCRKQINIYRFVVPTGVRMEPVISVWRAIGDRARVTFPSPNWWLIGTKNFFYTFYILFLHLYQHVLPYVCYSPSNVHCQMYIRRYMTYTMYVRRKTHQDK